uniref:Solute carrier family 17 member 3 n=1 Tax=Neovison vison TaxID=452646 RepID=A0A8C7ARN9_NEOVI
GPRVLGMSPTSGSLLSEESSSLPHPWLILCSTRYGIAFTMHMCNFITAAQCTVLNITIVAMVNSTDHRFQFNDSTEGLPGDSFAFSYLFKVPVYNWSPQIQGIIFSSLSYGLILMLFLSGYLAGRVGTKRVVGVSLFATSLFTFPSLQLELDRGSVLGGQHTLWEKWGPPHERSRLCSISLSGMILGSFTTILLGGMICQNLGWPFAFYIFGGIGCVYSLLWFVLVYDDPISHPWINIIEREYIVSSLADQIHQPLPIKVMLRSLPLWSICVCGFGHQWLIITLMVYTPTYINSVFNVNVRDNGFLSALPFLVAWVTGILGGQLADFLLTKNFRLVTVRKAATFLGNFPSSALLVVLPYITPSYITTMTFLILSCGLSSFCHSGIYINVLDIAPRRRVISTLIFIFLTGATRGFIFIAAILTPTVNGFLLDQDPEFGWRNVFLLLFAINLSGLITYLIFGEAVIQDWAKERKLTRL